MKLLFGQGTPAPLRHHLTDHSVDTLAEKGRSDKGNGEQLDLAEKERYEVSSLAIVLRELDAGRDKPVPYSPACSLQ